MPVTPKVLGRSAPAATTETVLYTVPASTNSVVSTITVCNRGGTSATFRVGVSVGGGALANEDYVYYDVPIGASDTFAATLGICLAATDEVRIFASTANLTFMATGQEIS